jgi:sulfite exporter TauE/SafE
MYMQEATMRIWHAFIINAEKILATIVILGVIVYALGSVLALIEMDWTQNEAFYEFIYRVLLIIIGLELARMLVTHSISAVLELLSFVIARKMLKPDLTSVDIILSVFAFVALAAARHYFMKGKNDENMLSNDKDKF